MAVVALWASWGCAGGAGPRGTTGSGDAWTDAQWRTLHAPRPAPLPGAVGLTISEISFLGDRAWPTGMPVSQELAVSELVTTNLLPRRDVRFVERRRFGVAAAAERSGAPRPPGRPATGVSPAAELGIGAAWIPVSDDVANVEIRLVELATGDVTAATRRSLSRDADDIVLARTIVHEALGLLAELGRRPDWDDPLLTRSRAVNAPDSSGVSDEALLLFLHGLDAEETWRWELARRGYQAALDVDPDFHEARAALRRTARLRLGGTLGES